MHSHLAYFPRNSLSILHLMCPVENKSYFERIEEKIKEKEKLLKRKLTTEEESEIKFSAMQGLWIDTAKEVAKEQAQE